MSNQTVNNQVAKVAKPITDQVLEKVNKLTHEGQLVLPSNYIVGNALKAAQLMLLETQNKDHQYALQYCTSESISYALLDMVTQGLNPAKKQCYFIMYGKKLQMMRSYMGTIAVAKRAANVKEVFANVIYEKDVFKFTNNLKTGRKEVTEHQQDFDNIDETKVKGAYAVVIYNDDTVSTEIMTMQQIRNSWEQGVAGGKGKPHNKFTSEMAKKTVIGRALKLAINSSNDEALYEDIVDPAIDVAAEDVKAVIVENANKGEIGFNPEDVNEQSDPEQSDPESDTELQKEPETKETANVPDWA